MKFRDLKALINSVPDTYDDNEASIFMELPIVIPPSQPGASGMDFPITSVVYSGNEILIRSKTKGG